VSSEKKELLDIVSKATMADKLLYGENGEMLKSIANKQVEIALKKLCFEVLNERQRDVLIERIRFLKYKLFDELNITSQEGELAYEELNDMQQIRTSEPNFG